jgi:hypothetical protein
MSGIAGSGDNWGMTSSACCGATPTRIDISTSESTLTMAYCGRCETRKWFSGDSETTLSGVLAAAKTTWNKRAAA